MRTEGTGLVFLIITKKPINGTKKQRLLFEFCASISIVTLPYAIDESIRYKKIHTHTKNTFFLPDFDCEPEC